MREGTSPRSQRGLLEMLISRSGEACVLQSVERVFIYLVSECSCSSISFVRVSLEMAPVTPFYSRRGTVVIHVFPMLHPVGEDGASEPCSLLL